MKLLENRILHDGQVLDSNILKVDSFLTHQVDTQLMAAIGQRFKELYAEQQITKVLTIEASGIAPALYTAAALSVPLVFAKKAKNLTLNDELLTTEVFSFTKQSTSTISISRKFISPEDCVLIVDDFLANGQASLGLIKLIEEAGADIAGIAIVIEKSFQEGRKLLEDKNLRVSSLARIAAFEAGKVVFAEADDAFLEGNPK